MNKMVYICDQKTLHVPVAVKSSHRYVVTYESKKLTMNALHVMPVIDG